MAQEAAFPQAPLHTWALFRRAHDAGARCEELIFSDTGLTPQQYAVLVAIKYIESPVTQTDVAHWLERKTNSITLIVDRMEKAGLVRRVRDLRDRRTIRLEITRAGMDAFDEATGPELNFARKLFSSLTPGELRLFGELLEKIKHRAVNCLKQELPPGAEAELKEQRQQPSLPSERPDSGGKSGAWSPLEGAPARVLPPIPYLDPVPFLSGVAEESKPYGPDSPEAKQKRGKGRPGRSGASRSKTGKARRENALPPGDATLEEKGD